MAEPRQRDVIVTRTLEKLRSKHKICSWADFEELGLLGKARAVRGRQAPDDPRGFARHRGPCTQAPRFGATLAGAVL
jgi:hypothetical protein